MESRGKARGFFLHIETAAKFIGIAGSPQKNNMKDNFPKKCKNEKLGL